MVLGTSAGAAHLNEKAAYVWTNVSGFQSGGETVVVPAMLFRIPLSDREAIGGIGVYGQPTDSLALWEDFETNVLRAGVRGGSYYDRHLTSDVPFEDDLAIVEIPLDKLGDGGSVISRRAYRGFAESEKYMRNYFIDGNLLQKNESSSDGGLLQMSFDIPRVRDFSLPFEFRNIVQAESGALIIGEIERSKLAVATVKLDEQDRGVRMGAWAALPSVGFDASYDEDEHLRASSFWMKGDLVAVYAYNEPVRAEAEPYSRKDVLIFLRRQGRRLTEAGQIEAAFRGTDEAECTYSCSADEAEVELLFSGERIFAVLGRDVVEARMQNGRIEEVQRLDFMRSTADGAAQTVN